MEPPARYRGHGRPAPNTTWTRTNSFKYRYLDSSQRFRWRQASRAHRRIQTRNHSDDKSKCNRPDERVAWYDRAPIARLGIDGGGKTTEYRTHRPARQREQSGFGDELHTDLAASRPESAAESDLASSLEHRDNHHVRDSDRRLDITQSMGRVGSCFDNAASESWNSTLEFELLSRRHFATKAQARREIAAFIDRYNHTRRHSSCEMKSPVDYEAVLAEREADSATEAQAA